jgi:hypothetical protein
LDSGANPAPKPVGIYRPALIVGQHLYMSGHGPLLPDNRLMRGRVELFYAVVAAVAAAEVPPEPPHAWQQVAAVGLLRGGPDPEVVVEFQRRRGGLFAADRAVELAVPRLRHEHLAEVGGGLRRLPAARNCLRDSSIEGGLRKGTAHQGISQMKG